MAAIQNEEEQEHLDSTITTLNTSLTTSLSEVETDAYLFSTAILILRSKGMEDVILLIISKSKDNLA